MKYAWIVSMFIAAVAIPPARADDDRPVDYAVNAGIKITYKISNWCVMWGFKNTNGYRVSISFEYDTMGSKGDVHHASTSDIRLEPNEYKGGGHFFGSELGLEDCPWVGKGQHPTGFKNFHLSVRNLDAEDAERARQEEQRRAEEQRRQDAKRLAEEQKRQEEEAKRKQEEQRRADEERRKREQAEREAAARQRELEYKQRREREAKAAQTRNASAGGALTPEQQREQKRREDAARGFQALRESQETNRRLGDSSARVAGAVFGIQGGNEASKNTSRVFRVLFGFGGRFVPVMENNSGDDIVEFSDDGTGGGFAVDLGFELWPRYVKRYGFGFGTEVGVAGMALPGGGMYALHAGAGAKGYFGNDAKLSLIGELGVFGQKVGSSGLFISTHSSGSGSYHTWRLGLGPRYCTTADKSGNHCETSWYGELLLDITSVDRPGTSSIGKVVRLGVDTRLLGNFGAAFELGIGYPAPGDTDYSLDDDADGSGTFVTFQLRKSWAWHSGSCSGKNSRRRAGC